MDINATDFNLHLKLGNALMSSSDDIARALRRAVDLIEEYGKDAPVGLLDQNGNSVGSFSFED